MSEIVSTPNRQIKSVRLVNFQNHKDNIFYLSEGLNVLTGSNDNGKSAIARALDFAINNTKSGDIVRYGQKKCFVEICFVDGAIYKRHAAPDNRVEYKYANEKEFTEFVSFGNKLPDKVKAFLGFPPSSNELGPLNYSNQNNKNFLIDQSPSHLPSIISGLVGVADLETASKNLFSELDRYSKDITKYEKEIKDLETELEDYITLDDDIANYNKLEDLLKDIDDLQNEIDHITELNNKVDKLLSKGRKCKKDLDNNITIIDSITEFVDKIELLHTDLSSTQKKFDEANKTIAKIEKNEKEIKAFSKIVNKEFESKINDIKLSLCLVNDINKSIQEIDDSNNAISDKQDEINIIDKNLSEIQILLDDLLTEIKNLGLVCEVCNTFGGLEF